MSESEFIDSIKCAFPYEDRQRATDIAEKSCLISPNAAFAVADEISRPPFGTTPDPGLCLELLSLLASRVSHPLMTPVIGLATKLVKDEQVSVAEAISVIREIERYPGQYSALSIAYFASDDIAGLADQEYSRITSAWDAP